MTPPQSSAGTLSLTFQGLFGGRFSLRSMASRIHVTRSWSSFPHAWSTPSAISSVSGRVIRTGYSFLRPMLFFVHTILTMAGIYRMYDLPARGNDMTIQERIAAELAKPMTHKCVTLYADGSAKEHLTRSWSQANNWAIGELRKVGRDLIDRETGKTVRVTDVYVAEI